MAFTIENGSGVIGANAYDTIAEVTAYLTDRGRETENSWSTSSSAVQQAAIIAATDYVEKRFGLRFKGGKLYTDLSNARATLTLTQQPTNGQQVVISTVTYTFNTTLGGANSILIETKLSDTIRNLIAAINLTDLYAGTGYGSGTVVHPDVSAEAFTGFAMIAVAKADGDDGNSVTISTDVTGASWNFSTLNGGNELNKPQPLSFPRAGLYDRDGIQVRGIPDRLKEAVAEYAVRSLSSALLPDPTVDDTGRAIVRKLEKVGPIEEDTIYESGAALSQLLRPYPAADRLLKEFLLGTSGRVTR